MGLKNKCTIKRANSLQDTLDFFVGVTLKDTNVLSVNLMNDDDTPHPQNDEFRTALNELAKSKQTVLDILNGK